MSVKRVVTLVLVPIIAVAAMFGPLCGARLDADLNGDHAVDVLDVQALVAETLAMGGTASDLNTDGAVDVLDLQCLLGGAQEATLPRSEEEPSSSDDATLPDPSRAPILTLAQARPVIVVPESLSTAHASVPHLGDDVCPVAHARQFLRELTPHAPPVRG